MLLRLRHATLVLASTAAVFTAFAACSDDDTPTTPGGGTEDGGADVQPDVPVVVTNDKESKQSGKIIRAQTTDEGVPNATVTIGAKTAITNASGDYEIIVPRNTPYRMTVAADGFYRLVEQELILKKESLARGSTNLLPKQLADLLAGLLPGRDTAKGLLLVKVNPRPPCASEEGTTLTLDPPGDAKISYFSGSLPSTDQPSTKGGTDFSAIFYNVDINVPIKVVVHSPKCKNVDFPVEVGDVTYTGANTIAEGGESITYLRTYVQDPLPADAGTD